MAGVTEIAPDVYRISVYATWASLQFNHFLVKDDEPLLFHTGLRGMFRDVREAVSKVIDPSLQPCLDLHVSALVSTSGSASPEETTWMMSLHPPTICPTIHL